MTVQPAEHPQQLAGLFQRLATAAGQRAAGMAGMQAAVQLATDVVQALADLAAGLGCNRLLAADQLIDCCDGGLDPVRQIGVGLTDLLQAVLQGVEQLIELTDKAAELLGYGVSEPLQVPLLERFEILLQLAYRAHRQLHSQQNQGKQDGQQPDRNRRSP